MPFTDGDIAKNFEQENENNYNMESPLDDVLNLVRRFVWRTYTRRIQTIMLLPLRISNEERKRKTSTLRHSFKPPSYNQRPVNYVQICFFFHFY